MPASRHRGGLFFFLDLWDEEGEADMHIDGELESVGDDRFIATLDDIAF